MTFGKYPGVTLAEARKKHGDALMDLQRGIDPAHRSSLTNIPTKS
jgi:hypothetical protein